MFSYLDLLLGSSSDSSWEISKTISFPKNLSQIKEAQRIATENIFVKKKIPFRTIEIVNKNEQSIGEIFTFFMLETILLGRALKVNPFDQPSVELIKKETKKIIIRG